MILFTFKKVILKALGNYLIVEDKITYIENAVVLSGGAFDRGNKAAELWHEKIISTIICTGENLSPDLKALNIDTLENQITKTQLIRKGVPNENIYLISKGTSTFEEAEVILNYCLRNELKEILIISSKFHTKRIQQVFKNKFKENGIQVSIAGASSSNYEEMKWWESENGLIALNNEYIKLFYYFVKY